MGDAQSIKVDIKATHDNSTPVELLVKPAEGAAHEAHEEAASPADGPSAPAIPDLQPETAHVAAPEPKEPEVSTDLEAPGSRKETQQRHPRYHV